MAKDRTKKGPTKKQNKWSDPFYFKSALFREKRAWLKGTMKEEARKRGGEHV